MDYPVVQISNSFSVQTNFFQQKTYGPIPLPALNLEIKMNYRFGLRCDFHDFTNTPPADGKMGLPIISKMT
jgi:hypothetical protein